jgi:hypothetical protein
LERRYTWHGFSISLNANKKGFSGVRASFQLGIFKKNKTQRYTPVLITALRETDENR